MIGDVTAASRDAVPSGRATSFVASDPADAADLLRRSARGDQAAFAELYDATSARLFGLVLRVVRDPLLSEQVTHEVYLHLWRTSARFDPGRGSALAWIMTVAHRAAVDRVRGGATPPLRPPAERAGGGAVVP